MYLPDSTAPFDIDYTIEGRNVGYKWFDTKGITPLFPFGFGLSYTTFSISSLQFTPGVPTTNGFQVTSICKSVV